SSISFLGPWGVGVIKAIQPNWKYKEDWDIAPFPQWPEGENKRAMSPLWRWAWVVNGATDKQDAAWAFINFMSSQGLMWNERVGDIPARQGWIDDPKVKDWPWIPVQLQDLSIGVPVPQTVAYNEL